MDVAKPDNLKDPGTLCVYPAHIETTSVDSPNIAGSYSSNQSAKELVLANSDLLSICFSYFDPDAFFKDIWEIGTTTRRRLLATALTCKAFFDPAMGLLWRMMESIIPVLKILPTFAKMNDTYTINGPVTPSQLHRLRQYAKNIRYLYLCGSQDSIAGHALLRLSHINPPIFPAVVTVLVSIPTLILRNVENLNCLFLAGSSPSLQTLSFTDVTYSTEDFIASFLSFASGGVAKIENLTLRGRLSDNSLGLLCEFNKLKTINLTMQSTTVQASAILHCARLEGLEELCVRLDNSSIFDASYQGSTIPFPTLKTLELCGPTTEVAKILTSMTAPTLQNITVSFSPSFGWVSVETVEACIEACGAISPLSLQHLRLLGGSGHGTGLVLSRGSLLPLASCVQLKSFELSGAQLLITDVDIQQICEGGAWKNLESLRLPLSTRRIAPSLVAVIILARCCPALQTLVASIDFSLHDYATLRTERSAAGRTANQLRSLTIFRVSPDSAGSGGHTQQVPEVNSMSLAIGVSRFLESHFPYLDSMQYITESIAEADWWSGVKALVEEYRQLRDEVKGGLEHF
ncbi:hypothetical protein CPB83DRAFT_858698 [Crepidotus variabilis]|uniref:F-box domain-containing protein n=1 Tax=Crepidotus variabilis TaxID=179855 RepID=A0A9P6JM59_9AGAR|nr:hypothetical protein CPB83DRAFT_858698 [Crepidotus variabilis]